MNAEGTHVHGRVPWLDGAEDLRMAKDYDGLRKLLFERTSAMLRCRYAINLGAVKGTQHDIARFAATSVEEQIDRIIGYCTRNNAPERL